MTKLTENTLRPVLQEYPDGFIDVVCPLCKRADMYDPGPGQRERIEEDWTLHLATKPDHDPNTTYYIGFHKADPDYVLFATADERRSWCGNLSPMYDTYNWYPIKAVGKKGDQDV